MKGNVFQTWFKEICSLIFVQAFQAFLLAIIMSIIISALASSSVSVNGGIDSIGLLAIIALYSLSKIELLIKNIFGLTSGVMDPSLAGGSKSSFLGSMMAYRGIRNVLDNGRKIGGGLFRGIGGTFKVRMAKNARNDYLLGKQQGDNGGGNEQLLNESGNYSGSATSRVGGGAITKLSDEIAALNRTLSQTNLDNKGKDQSDKLKSLEDAIKQAKKDQMDGFKQFASGVAETAGAVTLGTAGAMQALGTGDNVLTQAATAAGIGDEIGTAVANAITSAPGAAKTLSGGVKAEIRAHINGPTKTAYQKLEKELKDKNNRDIKDLEEKIKMYGKSNGSLNKSSGRSNRGNVDDI